MIDIQIEKISKNYGYKHILKELSFEIKTGERIGIVGSNGTGKSTILKILNGDENADSGIVTMRKDCRISMLSQIQPRYDNSVTVKDILVQEFKDVIDISEKLKEIENELSLNSAENEILLRRYDQLQHRFMLLNGYEIDVEIEKICSFFHIDESMKSRSINDLSGGQKTIIFFSALLLNKPDVILLDEPTNHLDLETVEWLENYLELYKGTVVVVSHDRFFLDKVVNKILLLEKGKGKIFFGELYSL